MITCSALFGVQTPNRSCLASTRYKIHWYFGGTNRIHFYRGIEPYAKKLVFTSSASVMTYDILVTAV